MKVAVLRCPYKIEVCEMGVPTPGIGEVMIRVRAVGICGTDVHAYRGEHPIIQFPRVLGHEISGEVVAVGEGVGGLHPGDHVVVNPMLNCGKCYPCRQGRPNCCVNLRFIGAHIDGGYSEFICIPGDHALVIPPSMPFDTAALCEPLTIGAHAVERGAIQDGDTVAIIGAGTIGLATLLMAKMFDVRVIMIDRVDWKLEFARKLGADFTVNVKKDDPISSIFEFTGGDGANVVVEAVGTAETVQSTVSLVSYAGRIVLQAITSRQIVSRFFELLKKEVSFIPSRNSGTRFPYVVKLMSEGRVDPSQFITHRLPLEAVAEAMEIMNSRPDEAGKVILTP